MDLTAIPNDNYKVVIARFPEEPAVPKNLGALEQMLMLATARLGDGAHGLAIRRELQELAGREVSHGAVYTSMDRLARQGLVASRIGEESPRGGGRKRKFYSLTPAGARAVEQSYRGLQRLADGVLGEIRQLAADDVD